MAAVGQASSFLSRAADTGRRLTAASGFPVIAAVALALLALIQVTATRTVTSGPTFDPTFLRPPPEVVDDGMPLTPLLALLATGPVALVRSRLLLAAEVITLANALTLVSGFRPTVAATIAMVVVGYLVARYQGQRAWLVMLLPFALFLVFPLGGAGDHPDSVAVMLVVATAAGMVGSTARSRSEEAARRTSEESLAGTLLEHAALGERARIARELHDVVAHHISMISVQAETARLTTPGMPPEGATRLLAIGDTAREALSEMRRLLGVLREDADPVPARAPQPGLADVADLVDGARASSGGASTRLILHGRPRLLEPGVELTAYRIVQEALTNSRRHAPGAAVDVSLDYGATELTVQVRDNGPGLVAGAASGHGLLGMRERAAMVGGVITVGTGSRGGFVVEATFPLDRVGTP